MYHCPNHCQPHDVVFIFAARLWLVWLLCDVAACVAWQGKSLESRVLELRLPAIPQEEVSLLQSPQDGMWCSGLVLFCIQFLQYLCCAFHSGWYKMFTPMVCTFGQRNQSVTSELIAFIGHHGTTCLPCSGEAESAGYNELLAEKCSCRCGGTTQPTEGPVDSEWVRNQKVGQIETKWAGTEQHIEIEAWIKVTERRSPHACAYTSHTRAHCVNTTYFCRWHGRWLREICCSLTLKYVGVHCVSLCSPLHNFPSHNNSLQTSHGHSKSHNRILRRT